LDEILASFPTPSMHVARKEGVSALQVHLAGLPEDYREVLRLQYQEKLELKEIAARMDRTEDAVHGLIFRAKKKLRTAMGQSSLWLSRK
ncbi:MAG: sigma-70 family RNA polymerase sigma factor, partial [Planctomycetales bacterium]|nr:sigma-70 family RNA polymerase sigma factor [Planctomycetales bacterium]NIP68829.1 sigma-70 family RNA polymerase sigma factor [Planctomycetales bacterium]